MTGLEERIHRGGSNGRLDEDATLVAPFSERQRLVNKPLYDKLDREYAAKDE